MILEILNWIACLLTIWGTWEVSQKHPNTLKVNILYGIGSILLILVFSIQINYSMLVMYCILLGFAIRGIINHKNESSPNRMVVLTPSVYEQILQNSQPRPITDEDMKRYLSKFIDDDD